MTYLPISMGYWSCYKRYIALLGYVVRTMAMGAYIVMGEDGKEVDAGEYCSFPSYFNLWKHVFPLPPLNDVTFYAYQLMIL
jgi:hypothetical protein